MKDRRTSKFVTIFGSLLGLLAIGYGSIALFFSPSEPVLDCGAKCNTERALFDLLGSPLSNLVIGFAWIASGLLVIVAMIRLGRGRS